MIDKCSVYKHQGVLPQGLPQPVPWERKKKINVMFHDKYSNVK